MHSFIKNYLHCIKNCIGPTDKKIKPRKSALVKNSSFDINRDPCIPMLQNKKCKFWTMQTNTNETCDAMRWEVSVLFKSTWAQYFLSRTVIWWFRFSTLGFSMLQMLWSCVYYGKNNSNPDMFPIFSQFDFYQTQVRS